MVARTRLRVTLYVHCLCCITYPCSDRTSIFCIMHERYKLYTL